jgi:hypothetical protein
LINPTKEIIMFRLFTIAAILALTVAAAQAGESLTTRIHDAAVAACAPEAASVRPVFHYGAITRSCVERISNAATVKYQAAAEAKTKAATAVND